MTKLLERAIQSVKSLSSAQQDEIAELMLQLAGEEGDVAPLTTEERAAIERSRAAAARGEFATEAEVQAVWKKHGL